MARAVGMRLRELDIAHPVQVGRAILSQMAGAIALSRAPRVTPGSELIVRDTRQDIRSRLKLR